MKKLINNSIKQIKENSLIHYTIIIFIGIILSIGLTKIQIKDTHDGTLHMLRLIGTLDTIEIGQIPPLINQNFCRGVGYSMNLFYPPIVTYLPLLIKLFVSNYANTLKIFGSICIILSGITMYKFTYQVTKNKVIALLSAIFYLIAPYKLANIYKRFAIGEFTALIFIPLVFLGLYNLFNQDGKKHYYIAIGAIGLMLSHTVTTLYTVIFCIIYILFNIKKLKEKEIIIKCAINIIFILLVSIMFWLPLLEVTSHAEYVIMDDDIMRTNSEFARYNVISFNQLFKNIGEEDGTTYLIGIPTIIGILLTFLVINKIDSKYKEFYLLSIIFSLISIFMVSRYFPWIIMPNILCKLQYPWRLLGFFIFFISFICGVNLYNAIKIIRKDIFRIIIIIIFVIFSIYSSISIMSLFYTEDNTKDKEYEKYILENKKISHMQINRDYMPTKAILAKDNYVLTRKDETYILSGSANILKEEKENLTDIIEFNNMEENTILEFPYYYYVGYKITLETEEGTFKLESCESENGYLSCTINKNVQESKIKVEYVGTPVTYISYILSPVSLVAFIIYIIYEIKKGDKDDKN